MGHDVAFRVYYEDTDAGGIMYHARYLAFAERARTEALRALGVCPAQLQEREGIGFVVRHLSVDYQRALKLDDIAHILTSVIKLQSVRCTLIQQITAPSGIAAELNVMLACVRLHDARPVRIPPHFYAALSCALEPHEKTNQKAG